MNKIFFLGDFKSNTGPANVNKNIKKILKEKAIYSTKEGKISRVFEMIYKIIISNYIVFCSFSKLDIYGIKLAKLLNKKTIYLMHGYVNYEQAINKSYNTKKIKQEEYIINNVDKVICVSKLLINKVNKDYPLKLDYIYNGINFDEIIKYKTNKKEFQIISTGGGMPQKNNLIICQAIKMLNDEFNFKLKYIVMGKTYGYKERFLKYDFVEFYETLPYEECLKKIAESALYIQNSSFETFGLSIAEAICLDCKILISNNVGIIDLLQNISENEIIYNINNIDEIMKKILILINSNFKSKIKIDRKENTIEARVNDLYNKIIKL